MSRDPDVPAPSGEWFCPPTHAPSSLGSLFLPGEHFFEVTLTYRHSVTVPQSTAPSDSAPRFSSLLEGIQHKAAGRPLKLVQLGRRPFLSLPTNRYGPACHLQEVVLLISAGKPAL